MVGLPKMYVLGLILIFLCLTAQRMTITITRSRRRSSKPQNSHTQILQNSCTANKLLRLPKIFLTFNPTKNTRTMKKIYLTVQKLILFCPSETTQKEIRLKIQIQISTELVKLLSKRKYHSSTRSGDNRTEIQVFLASSLEIAEKRMEMLVESWKKSFLLSLIKKNQNLDVKIQKRTHEKRLPFMEKDYCRSLH